MKCRGAPYDAVGNLLSITRSTGVVGAPAITAFTTNTGNAGETVSVSLTGTNLTNASLATTYPGILVRNVVTTPTAMEDLVYHSDDGTDQRPS